MSSSDRSQTVAQLKAAFDASFAAPLTTRAEAREELLALRVGGRAAAVRIRHVAEVHACPPLTSLPSDNPALAGLAAVRGALVAVYDLGILAAFDEQVRRSGHILLCARDRSVALLFEDLLGHRSVPSSVLHAPANADAGTRSRVVVRIADTNHDLIDIPHHLESIHGAARARAHEE